jgi:4'-phosphopantetheinyl transferase
VAEWIDDLDEWSGRLPVVLVATGLAPEEREAALRNLVARQLGMSPDAVAIERVKGRPPVLVRPKGSGLHLSMSSRGSLTAVAVAGSQVGVDVEVVDETGEIPWNVLHAKEAASLAGGNARSFARLWSLKEAYLKASGAGLSREPSSFAVNLVGEANAVFEDPIAAAPVIEAETIWRRAGRNLAALSIVVLKPQISRPAG